MVLIEYMGSYINFVLYICLLSYLVGFDFFNFHLSLHLLLYSEFLSSQGSDESAHMCRLA